MHVNCVHSVESSSLVALQGFDDSLQQSFGDLSKTHIIHIYDNSPILDFGWQHKVIHYVRQNVISHVHEVFWLNLNEVLRMMLVTSVVVSFCTLIMIMGLCPLSLW